MADISDLWKAICGVLIADSTLTTTLGVAAASIWYAEDGTPAKLAYPGVRVKFLTEGPVTDLSAVGAFEPRVDIDIFGVSQAVNRQIAWRLDQLLDIPRLRPAGLSAGDWKINLLMRRDTRAIGKTGITNADGASVYQLNTDWTMKAATVVASA